MRTTKTQRAIAVITANHGALIATLNTLAALRGDACECGRSDDHARCGKCKSCKPGSTHGGGCAQCGAKSNYYYSPVHMWEPRRPFAATFATEMLDKMLRCGWAPSDKQIALANKLAAEQSAPKPTSAEKPVTAWLSTRMKTWQKYVNVSNRAFSLLPSTQRAIDAVNERCANADEKHIAREAFDLVTAYVTALISDTTGYDTLTTAAEIADAMQAIAPSGRGKNKRGDKEVYAALSSLLDTHGWLVSKGMIRETAIAA